MKKNNEGITLIALVITIIVLIILASVSIAMLTGDNGLLRKAQTAKEEAERSEVEEDLKLKILAVQANNQGDFVLSDFVQELEDDEQREYLVMKITKVAELSSEGDIKTVESLGESTEIYVTNKGYEFKVTSGAEIEYKGKNGEAVDTDKEETDTPQEPEVHTHSYVATELKDCSDEIKAEYNFKNDNATGYAGYGNEVVKYEDGFEVGDIVYVKTESVYSGANWITHVGYHEITSVQQLGNVSACYTTFLGDSYMIEVCSSCGDSKIHTHNHVATELKDCSDNVKTAYNFKDATLTNQAAYGNETFYYSNPTVGDIVYVPETVTFSQGGSILSKGYHKVTSIPSNQSHQYVESELLTTSYIIDVCACGDYKHTHNYVATELKDCSDNIKAAYNFKDVTLGSQAGYGNETFYYSNPTVGDIVYAPKTVSGASNYVVNKGYHKVTSIASGNQYVKSELLGDSYIINICSKCGDYEEDTN